MIRVGTAGWSLPAAVRDRFGDGGSVLERYARRFPMVEINSSFYWPHQPKTYARWAATTSPGFRFSVKAPKSVTHEARLVGAEAPMLRFIDETAYLSDKLGCVLIQLPPSLAFDPAVVDRFLRMFRANFSAEAALEPRHPSWFTAEAEALLITHRIARVAADPAVVETAARPGGWTGFQYWRLHGSPHLYATPYGEARVNTLADQLTSPAYVVFDNTMLGAATTDALTLLERLAA